MKKISTAILLLSFVFSNAQSTMKKDSLKLDKVQFSIIPTFSTFDLGDLNNYLKANGVPQAKEGLQFLPVASIKFPIFGTHWSLSGGVSWAQENQGEYDLNQRTSFYELEFEAYSFRKNRHSVFANIAVGSVLYRIDIDEATSASSFSSGLDDFGGAMRIESNNNSYIALKTGYDWGLSEKNNFSLGFRFGYRFRLNKEKLELNGHNYSDSPKSSASGVFFGVALSIQ